MERPLRAWIGKISPQVLEQKLNLQYIGQSFLYFLTGIFCLSAFLFLGGFYYQRRLRKWGDKQIESFRKDTLNILKRDNHLIQEELGPESAAIALDLKKELQGQGQKTIDVKEYLPLPALILDEQLNSEWVNDRFREEFDFLREGDWDCWESIAAFSNMGDINPVLDSLKTLIGGVHRVRIGEKEGRENPYDMHIRVLNHNESARLLVVFVPLGEQEQGVQDFHTISNAIKKSLLNLDEGKAALEGEELADQLSLEQNIELFDSIMAPLVQAKHLNNELMEQIDNLVLQGSKYSELIENLKLGSEENKGQLSQIKSGLKEFKSAIISLLEENSKLREDYDTLSLKKRSVVKDLRSCLSTAQRVQYQNTSLREVFGKLGTLKNEIAKYRESIDYNLKALRHKIDARDEAHRYFSAVDKNYDELKLVIKSFENLIGSRAGMTKNDELQIPEFISLEEKEVIDPNASYGRGHSDLEQSIISSLKQVYEATKQTEKNLNRGHSTGQDFLQ